MKTGKLELNEQEAQVLINIMNVATKAAGLDVAESCVVFTKRIHAAFAAEVKVTEEVAAEEAK